VSPAAVTPVTTGLRLRVGVQRCSVLDLQAAIEHSRVLSFKAAGKVWGSQGKDNDKCTHASWLSSVRCNSVWVFWSSRDTIAAEFCCTQFLWQQGYPGVVLYADHNHDG
jgi:hypothetical protein